MAVIAFCKKWVSMEYTWIFFAFISGFILVGVIGISIWWGIANGRAEMINSRYQTDYTAKEIFYHYDTIKDMIEGEKIKVLLMKEK